MTLNLNTALKPTLENPNTTEVREVFFENSSKPGYGVFAKEDIKDGDIIEEATYFLTGYFNDDKNYVALSQMCFTLNCPCESCQKREGKQYILITGNAMLYNTEHKNPSAELFVNRDLRYVKIVALRDIQKNEEIRLNHGYNYNAWLTVPVRH